MSARIDALIAARDTLRERVASARAERAQVVRLVPGLAGRGCSASPAWMAVQAKLGRAADDLAQADAALAAEIEAMP